MLGLGPTYLSNANKLMNLWAKTQPTIKIKKSDILQSFRQIAPQIGRSETLRSIESCLGYHDETI
ncbi:MAG: hypothetical protein CK430_05635 [Legionella sp.]|nr:MAG: hypothetical protein CK430_05635 [Legionella sp.]